MLIQTSHQLHFLPGTTSASNGHDLALARQFFDQSQSATSPGGGIPLSMPIRLPPPSMAPVTVDVNNFPRTESWSVERQDPAIGFDIQTTNAMWASEFERMSQPPSVTQHNVLHAEGTFLDHYRKTNLRLLYIMAFQERPSFMSHGGIYQNPMASAMYGMNVTPTPYPGNYNALAVTGQSKGKGKGRDADFEAAFAQVVDSLSSAQIETPRIVEIEAGRSTVEEVPVNVVGEAQKESTVTDQDTEFSRYDQGNVDFSPL
jgi:peroxin-5